jgi:hypothetical protein
MRKMRRFNGEDDSYVEGTATSLRDDTEDQLRQNQLERMAKIVNSSESSTRETPAAAPVAAAPKAKPAIVTLQQLNAFKAKYGADKDLTDYMNAQAGGLKRRNKFNPTLGEAKDKNAQDAADAIDPGDIRTRELGKTRGGPSYDIAGKPSNAGPDVEYVPDSLNRRTGATAKMMSDFNNQANKRTGRGYASGGSVSASRRGDGIAQRGKTRGKMC